jgi:cytochrome P450
VTTTEEHDMTSCPVAHDYDPLDPEIVRDPYPILNRLRSQSPVFYLPPLDHYIVTRFDDIEAILMDRDTWSAANASSPLTPLCPAAQEVLNAGFKRVPTLNNSDPPRHGPMRKSVLAVMTPRRLRGLEPTLREYAENLIKAFQDEPVVELVTAFSFPFPGYAGFSLLGFPDHDTDMLKEWSRTRVLLTYGRLSEQEQIDTAGDVVAMWRYVEDFVARRANDPVDDLTSDLIRLSREKPDQLNQFDIVNIVYSMALAGHETTTSTIGSAVYTLLRHRDQWERLIADPGLIPNAVEEILRFDGPVLNHRRVAKVDTEVGGVPVPAGARMLMCFAAADHDPAHFGSDADEFRIDRPDAELHLSFGKGPHLCLGAPLGRLVTVITLQLLTTMTPKLELVPDQDIAYNPNALFRGLRSLMVAPQGLAHARAHGALSQGGG